MSMVLIMDIKTEIDNLKKRNKKVEGDKAWETSFFRRATITVITYIIATLFLWLIDAPNYWLNSLVPTGGYVLSTFTIPVIKRWWVENRYEK
jgi:hypothetical protein